jgi:hypothetical protein
MALDHVFVDWISLGAIKRPWDENRFTKTGPILAYYRVEDFEPAEYRPGYPNPAMLRMSERDGAWMARIIARMTPAHINRMIDAAKIKDKTVDAELRRVVLGRRQKVLSRYLGLVASLTDPEVKMSGGTAELCLEDLSVSSGIVPAKSRKYGARAYLGEQLMRYRIPSVKVTGSTLCAELPKIYGATPDKPRYLIMDMYAFSGSANRVPARVHLYHLGGNDFRVVGLQRPYEDDPPEGYAGRTVKRKKKGAGGLTTE